MIHAAKLEKSERLWCPAHQRGMKNLLFKPKSYIA